MSLRLLKILVPEGRQEPIVALLEEHGHASRWVTPADEGRILVDVVLEAEGNEPFFDALQRELSGEASARLTLLPVVATVPRLEAPDEDGEGGDEDGGTDAESGRRVAERINREELHAAMSDSATTSRYYLGMTALSAVVASAGLLMGDVAVIIGAMVIAPLLGPNMALAFSNTLGDRELGISALRTSAAGAAVAFAVAVAIGGLLPVNPTGPEILARSGIGFGHIALALASGAAGALSLTRGVAAGLVGVMVAVALLPPLAAAGLLFGAGRWSEGGGALLLVGANVACVNLAAIATFLIQGIRPLSWWEEARARRAARRAAALWAVLVLVFLVVVWLTLAE